MPNFFIELADDIEKIRGSVEKISKTIEKANRILSHFIYEKRIAERLLENRKELDQVIKSETISLLETSYSFPLMKNFIRLFIFL